MPEPTQSAAYDELLKHLRETAVLYSVSALASWDQETFMPPGGAALRGEQMAALSAIVHERKTSARVADLLAECEADPALAADEDAAANLRGIRRDFDRATKLPADLVRAYAETTSLAMSAWKDARERSDFAAFAPWLEKVVRLSRERAHAFGWPQGGTMYDALLEEYEPGASTAMLQETFAALRAGLTPLIRAVAESGRRPDTAWMQTALPMAEQAEFNRGVVEQMGFSLEAGRLDVSTHPFCEGVGPGDTRLTTRYREEDFAEALSSTMHEAGHGLYEQNLPKAERLGQPLAEAASFGIHESQSRMWENLVGRSRPFWEWCLARMKATYRNPTIDGLDVDTAYRGMNVVEPNLIRIESDEATYNLHIMLRFDLERALLSGDLAISDLPGAWNERVKADLGLEVPDDRRGVLQDIHWSMGGLGYFPTYSLGNLYAAQFWVAIREQLPDLDAQIARGEFAPLLGWLKENVFAHGRRYTAPQLCQRITGRPLSHEPLLRYLEGKLKPIYGL